MAVLTVYNLTGSPVTLAAGNPPRTIPASPSSPSRGPGMDVTSELRGLSTSDYDLLIAQQAGTLEFVWDGTPEYSMTGSGGNVPAPVPWVGSGGSNVFVFQPGGTASGNVFTTWEACHAARAALPGPAIIEVDATFDNVEIPEMGGPWDMSWTILRGRVIPNDGPPWVSVVGQFTNLLRMEDIYCEGNSGITGAYGSVVCPVQASVPNGSSMTISDGMAWTITFWFDVTGTFVPVGGYDDYNVRVNLSAAVTDEDVKAAFILAIQSTFLQVWINDPGPGMPGLFCLVNRRRGSQGNMPITTSVGGTITAEGMTGGEGGPMIVTPPDTYTQLYMRNAAYEDYSDGGLFVLVRSYVSVYMYEESWFYNDDGLVVFTADSDSGIYANLYQASEIDSSTIGGWGDFWVIVDASSYCDPDDQDITSAYRGFHDDGAQVGFQVWDGDYWNSYPENMTEAVNKVAARTDRRVTVFPGAVLPAGDGFTMHAQDPGGAALSLTTGWLNLLPYRGLKITRSDAGPASVTYGINMEFTDGEQGGFNLIVPRNGSAETHLAGKVVSVSTQVDPVSTSDFVAGKAFSIGFKCADIHSVSCDGIVSGDDTWNTGREATIVPDTAPNGVHCYAVEATAAGGKS